MSAKGRGGESREYDYYPTPHWCVDRLLDRHCLDLLYQRESLLEPTVGDGAIVRAVDAWWADMVPSRAGSEVMRAKRWTGVELRRDAVREDTRSLLTSCIEGVDFRVWEPPARFDLAIGNPPFGVAESIVRRCIEISDVTAMLLRVGFLGAQERLDFWRTVGVDPVVRVLPDRPSFDGEGTDSATYAWFIWGADLSGPRVDVLDETPIAVRRAAAEAARLIDAPDPRQVSLFGEVA